jgi:hypothetical protein
VLWDHGVSLHVGETSDCQGSEGWGDSEFMSFTPAELSEVSEDVSIFAAMIKELRLDTFCPDKYSSSYSGQRGLIKIDLNPQWIMRVK